MECRRCLAMRILSVRQTRFRSVQIFIPHERSFSLVFLRKKWLVGATPSQSCIKYSTNKYQYQWSKYQYQYKYCA